MSIDFVARADAIEQDLTSGVPPVSKGLVERLSLARGVGRGAIELVEDLRDLCIFGVQYSRDERSDLSWRCCEPLLFGSGNRERRMRVQKLRERAGHDAPERGLV